MWLMDNCSNVITKNVYNWLIDSYSSSYFIIPSLHTQTITYPPFIQLNLYIFHHLYYHYIYIIGSNQLELYYYIHFLFHMEKHTEITDKTDHYNDWGRKTFETATKYIEYTPLYAVLAKQSSTTISPKRYGPARKNIYIKSTAG